MTFNIVALILSIFFAVVGVVAESLSFPYVSNATKPLTLPPEFTFKIRDWAVKPYVDI
jgi:hypothetical protein